MSTQVSLHKKNPWLKLFADAVNLIFSEEESNTSELYSGKKEFNPLPHNDAFWSTKDI